MLHQLDWLAALEIQYDASTFDTDPFEPQPDGVGTIFPFWKECANGRGYVELPYTLPQDSSLFILFAERTPEIWLKKLDWIAAHGGMALVNVHPDYTRMEGGAAGYRTFPVEIYSRLLQHVREKHGQSVWHALPKEVAAWYARTDAAKRNQSSSPALRAVAPVRSAHKPSLSPGRVAVVLYSYYLIDPRPRRETEALVKAGMEADVICLRRDNSEPAFEVVNGVNIHRVSLSRRRHGQFNYVLRYGFFFLCAFWRLTVWSLRRKFTLAHVHNMPDFLVFTALVPRLRGAKVILDMHDPMPELFQSIYGLAKETFGVRLLRRIEKESFAFADLVLTPNIAFKEVFVARGAPPEKIEIVMNSPQEDIFDPKKFPPGGQNTGAARSFSLMYHGLLVERHGLDLAVQAAAQLRARIPGLKLYFYGEQTDCMEKIIGLVRELGLEKVVEYGGFKSQQEIAQIISTIDLGVIPNRLNQFTSINFPTRIFEYLAMNKPVLMPRTKGVRDYFAEDEILYFEADKTEDLARMIAWAYEHPAELRGVMEKGRKVFDRHRWAMEGARFTGLVNNMVGTKA
jgi:glycosyltransferase involved in cell wall biosynthesis